MNILKNPLKTTVNNMIKEDKYHMIRGFLTLDSLYCWKSYESTHTNAIITLKQEYNVTPVCGIVFDSEKIQLADSYKDIELDETTKELLHHHISLKYLFGEGYKIIGLD